MAEEESQNQSNPIPPNQIETKPDRISALPDFFLAEILSRLPETKYAIRTGTLSKRWKHLWPQVHNLIFSYSFPRGSVIFDTVLSEYVSFVDKTLKKCSLNLNKFQLHIPYDIRYEPQVNGWLDKAISLNVQVVDLCLDNGDGPEFVLDQSFFSNSCFTHLELGGCVINPTGDISWSNLKSLYIFKGALDEDLIQNILSGCPLLETLGLVRCYGYRRLDITSKSVKRLVFTGYVSPEDDLDDIVKIHAPYVLSLTITGDLLLSDVSSLVEAKFDYFNGGHHETTRREEREEMFKGLILNLRNVKELTIGNGRTCQKIFTRLKAKGLIFPSNIKFLDWCGPNEDEDEEEEEEAEAEEDDEYGDEDDEYGDEEDEGEEEEEEAEEDDEYGDEEDEDQDQDQDQDEEDGDDD